MTFKLKAIFAFLQPEAVVCGAIAVILTFLASVELSVDEKKTREKVWITGLSLLKNVHFRG